MPLPTPETYPGGMSGAEYSRAVNNGRITDYGSITIRTPVNGDIPLSNYLPLGCKIVKTVTQTEAGSCQVTFKNGSTPLGGAANSASTTRQEQNHSSANEFVPGDRLRATIANVSTCQLLTLTWIYEYPTAEAP